MTKIETLDTKAQIDFDKIYNDLYVDLDSEPIKPEPIVQIGFDDRSQRVDAMTRGEYSAIVGGSKAKKTFLKSLIAAAKLGDISSRSNHLRGFGNGLTLDIDTEQGKYYAYRSFKRVETLAGNKKNYKAFGLRPLSADERLNFIDELLNREKNLDLVFIDGIADLIEDVNDLKVSNKVTNMLLKWTSDFNCHICVVLHTNFNSPKPTGHLGSSVLKKVESILWVQKLMKDNGEILTHKQVKVSHNYSRGVSFNDFYLEIDENGLPFTTNAAYEDDSVSLF